MVFRPLTFHGHEASIADHVAGPASMLEARVAEALARAADIDASNVSVTSVDGQVVLQGTVAFPEEVAIAGDIASRIAGAASFDNLIVVATNDNTRPAGGF